MNRLSHEMPYLAIVTFADVGAECEALFSSSYALSSVAGRLV